MDWQQIQPFLVALAIGLLIGLERERSHIRKIPAGSRSFALLSLAGVVSASFDEWVVVAGLVGVSALVALSYFRTSAEDAGITTAIAALVAYLLGALALTRPALAVALAVVVAGLLVSKARIHHFAREGLLKRIVGGHFGVGGPELMRLIMEDKIEAYNLPQGVLVQLPKQIAGRRPGFMTKVGLETFVDPRIEGAKVNASAVEDLVEVVHLDGEEWLYFRNPKVDVALLRGSYADENGNVSMAREGVLLESLSIAQAARASGGRSRRHTATVDRYMKPT